jgi:hypothetical protein
MRIFNKTRCAYIARKGSSVTCYTDSQNAASIILKGSKVHELQCLALTIFEFCAKNDTEIHTVWIPRELNEFTPKEPGFQYNELNSVVLALLLLANLSTLCGPHNSSMNHQ